MGRSVFEGRRGFAGSINGSVQFSGSREAVGDAARFSRSPWSLGQVVVCRAECSQLKGQVLLTCVKKFSCKQGDRQGVPSEWLVNRA